MKVAMLECPFPQLPTALLLGTSLEESKESFKSGPKVVAQVNIEYSTTRIRTASNLPALEPLQISQLPMVKSKLSSQLAVPFLGSRLDRNYYSRCWQVSEYSGYARGDVN
jgi:hypothetical protein